MTLPAGLALPASQVSHHHFGRCEGTAIFHALQVFRQYSAKLFSQNCPQTPIYKGFATACNLRGVQFLTQDKAAGARSGGHEAVDIDAFNHGTGVFEEPSLNISLKERRKNEKKDKFPPHPLLKKDKEKKQEEKTRERATTLFSDDFDERKEAFRRECLALTKVYDVQQVTDFFIYWAEESKMAKKMRWEAQKTWNTKMRMKRWVNNEIANAKAVSKMRAKKVKQQQEKEKLQQQMQTEIANERAQANSQLEAEIERTKQGAGGLEEIISKNPHGFLASVQKKMQAKKEKSEK